MITIAICNYYLDKLDFVLMSTLKVTFDYAMSIPLSSQVGEECLITLLVM